MRYGALEEIMPRLAFWMWVVMFMVPNPILVSTQARADQKHPMVKTVDAPIQSVIVDDSTVDNPSPAPVVEIPQVEAEKELQVPHYTTWTTKKGTIPDLRNVVLGFDGPVDGDIRIALMQKYPGIQVVENCNLTPVICVFVGKVDPKGYSYGSASGYNAGAGSRSNFGRNSSRSNSYGVGSSIWYSNEVLKGEINVVLYTNDFIPQYLGYVSNLAFPGTQSSDGYVSGSNWNSSANSRGSRSNGDSWSYNGYGTTSVSPNQAIRASLNDGIKRLFGASLDNWLVRGARRIDNRIHPVWMPYADEAISQAFNR